MQSHKMVAQAFCENYRKETGLRFPMEQDWGSRSPLSNSVRRKFTTLSKASSTQMAEIVAKTRSGLRKVTQVIAKSLRNICDGKGGENSSWNSGVPNWKTEFIWQRLGCLKSQGDPEIYTMVLSCPT
jgi:hypothetical protein